MNEVAALRRFFGRLQRSGVFALDCNLEHRSFSSDHLFPEEVRAAEPMREQRRHEFIAGRVLARQLMEEFGVLPAAIAVGKGRAPIWPEGLTGSITHSRSICAVAMARSDRWAGIGIDLELFAPIEPDLHRMICSPGELARLTAQSQYPLGNLVCLVFSAKEAFFKAWFPLTGIFLEYRDAQVWLAPDLASFTLELVGPIDSPASEPFRGDLEIAHGHVAASLILDSHPMRPTSLNAPVACQVQP